MLSNFEDAIGLWRTGWYYFFFNDGSKSINLTTCGYPESLRARVASLGFVSRDPRAAPARFSRADTSLVYLESAPGAKPSRVFGYHLDIFPKVTWKILLADSATLFPRDRVSASSHERVLTSSDAE